MTTYRPRTKTVEAAQFTGYDSIHALAAIIGTQVTTVTIQNELGTPQAFLEASSGICVQRHEWLVRDGAELRVLTVHEFRERYESNGPSVQINSIFEHPKTTNLWPNHAIIADAYGNSQK